VKRRRQHDKMKDDAIALEMIHRNAQRLKRLAEDILDVTKIETQSLILNKERLNLNIKVLSRNRVGIVYLQKHCRSSWR
jgi:hypothetical protein